MSQAITRSNLRFAGLLLMLAAMLASAGEITFPIQDPLVSSIALRASSSFVAGDYNEAEKLYRDALGTADKRDPDSRTYLMNRIADSLRTLRKHAEAEALARASFTLTKQQFEPMSFQMLDAQFTLARTLDVGRPEMRSQAIQLLTQAADIRDSLHVEQLGERIELEYTAGLGIALVHAGEYERGQKYLEKGLQIYANSQDARLDLVVQLEYWMGKADYHRGFQSSSIAHLRKAQHFAQELHRAEDFLTQDIHLMLGLALTEERKAADAEHELREALRIARRREANQQNLGTLIFYLAHVLMMREQWDAIALTREQWEEIASYADESYTVLRNDPTRNGEVLGRASLTSGFAYRGQGDIKKAIDRFQRSYQLLPHEDSLIGTRIYAAYYLGESLWGIKDFCAAQPAYQNVIDLVSKHPEPNIEWLTTARNRLSDIATKHCVSTNPRS